MTVNVPVVQDKLYITPYGSGYQNQIEEQAIKRETTKAYMQLMLPSSAIIEIDKEIDALSDLDYNWGGEQEKPVSSQAINYAKRLVEAATFAAYSNCIIWLPPAIAPTHEGGIDLYWSISKHQLLLIVSHNSDAVTCVSRNSDCSPQRRVISFDSAIITILAFLIYR